MNGIVDEEEGVRAGEKAKAERLMSLREIAHRYGLRPVDEGPFVSVPLADEAAWQDEAETAARVQRLAYERPVAEWGRITCTGWPSQLPVRFIDGSVFSRTVASFTVESHLRPSWRAWGPWRSGWRVAA